MHRFIPTLSGLYKILEMALFRRELIVTSYLFVQLFIGGIFAMFSIFNAKYQSKTQLTTTISENVRNKWLSSKSYTEI